MRLALRLAALALLPACGSAPSPAGAPAPDKTVSLAYTLPIPATASYAVNDSTVFDIQGGAVGDVHAAAAVSAVTAISYAQAPVGLEATIRVTEFKGTFSNSAMGGAGPSASEADIQGPAIVAVSPRGAATIETMPTLTPVMQNLGVSRSFFRRFFVRLPAGGARPGAVWVDTLNTSDEDGGTKAVLNEIVTSTFVRDTIVAGRSLAFVTTSSQRTLSISGLSQGVEISQKLTGSGSGSLLWDPERHLLIERIENSQMKGTFDLPQMGITGLPVTARGSLRISMQ